MQPKLLLALSASFVFASVACGGATIGDDGPGDRSDPKPAPDHDGKNEEGGGDEKGTPMPAPACTAFESTPVASCAKATAFRANAALKLQIHDNSCFSGSCSGEITSTCKATVTGDTISLEMVGRACSSGVDMSQGCTADCRWVITDCELPPLAAGEYHVVGVRDPYNKAGEVLDTKLVVTDEATASSCPANVPLSNH